MHIHGRTDGNGGVGSIGLTHRQGFSGAELHYAVQVSAQVHQMPDLALVAVGQGTWRSQAQVDFFRAYANDHLLRQRPLGPLLRGASQYLQSAGGGYLHLGWRGLMAAARQQISLANKVGDKGRAGLVVDFTGGADLLNLAVVHHRNAIG